MSYFKLSIFLAIFLINHMECLITRNTTTVTLKPEYFRLLKNVKLDTYSLKLKLDESLKTFSGSNVITMKTTEAANEFKFNYDKLIGLDDYDNYKIEEIDSGKTHFIEKIILCDICQTVSLFTKDKVPKSAGVRLTINYFAGNLSTENLNGLYLTRSKDNTLVIAANFNPIFARKVFPCYDEPSFRAKFDFEMTFPPNIGSCSFNTRIIKTSQSGKYVTYKFDTTPILSVHLLNFVMTDYQSVTKQMGRKSITIYACSTAICKTKFPSKEALIIIETLQKLFSITLEFEHLVLYALPDINAKIQAGWSIITYPEEDLLYLDSENSVIHQQRIISSMTESIIMMLLNVLLPIDWWTNTWLISSLSKFLAQIAVKEMYPEWDIPSLNFDIEMNVEADTNPDTQPLNLPDSMVFQPFQILNEFKNDKINKGLGILTMLGNIMGPDAIKKVIPQFVNENKFKDLTMKLFFDHIDKYETPKLTGAATLPAKMSVIMKSWLDNSGVPVLNIKKDGRNVLIEQTKLIFPNTYNDVTTSTTTRWYVPISFTLLSNPDFSDDTPKLWVTPDSDIKITNILKDDNDAIVLDNQGSGLYTINYDKPFLKIINKVLKDKPDLIDDTIRGQIMFNINTMCMAGLSTFDTILDLVELIDEDTSPKTWIITLENIGNTISVIGEDTSTVDKILETLGDKLTGFIDTISFENIGKDPETTKVQTLAIEWGVKVNNPTVITVIKREFDNLVNGKEIPRDILKIVCTTAIKENPMNFFAVEKILKEATDGKLILDLIDSLGSTPNKYQLLYFLGEIVNPDSYLKPQYRTAVIKSVLNGSPASTDALLEFVLFTIQDIIKSGIDVVHEIIMPLSEKIVTPEQLCQLNSIVCCDCNGLVVVTPEENDKIWKTISGNHLRSVNIRMQAENFYS